MVTVPDVQSQSAPTVRPGLDGFTRPNPVIVKFGNCIVIKMIGKVIPIRPSGYAVIPVYLPVTLNNAIGMRKGGNAQIVFRFKSSLPLLRAFSGPGSSAELWVDWL